MGSSEWGSNLGIWDKELITAALKRQENDREISEQEKCARIQDCLDQGADVNTVDGDGDTVLHVAARRGHQSTVQFLLRAGARVDILNREGDTAIRLAENLGNQEIANYLKNPTNLAIRRSTGPCGLVPIADNQSPRTSPESASVGENPSQWRNLDNQGRNFESATKNSNPKRAIDDEHVNFTKRLRTLKFIDDSNRKLHQKVVVDTGSERTSPMHENDYDDEDADINSMVRINDEETYDGSGLKLSLHGMVYQLKHLMLILHRAWRMGYTFRLATEMDAAGKFDDVVLHYQDDKGDEVHRFIQVKHKQDGTKSISARHLLDVNDGEFGVLKYFVSWRKIKRHPDFGGKGPKTFILCTNIGLDLDSLKDADINVRKIEEPDDFLRVTNRGRQPPRYKIHVDKRSGLYDTLKLASDVHRLARVLAERICDSQDIHLNTDIMKSYHVALGKEIVDVNAKRLSVKFIKNDGLSEKAMEFRKIFFHNTRRLLSKKFASETDIWEFLEQTSLKLSSTFGKKSQTSNKSESTQFTELPEDYINDKEIFDFLNEFVLAVDQPNETELGDMIKREIGAESQFNLLDAGLLKDSFQNVILDWFKEKQGKFLKTKDAEDFFYEMEVKLGSLITMALSFELSEKLNKLEIEFDCEHTELLNFINRPDATPNQILELISSEQTLLTALRVYQTLTQLQKYEDYRSFIFVRLETLLLPKIMEQVLRAFEWPHNHDLLVVDCESICPKQYSQKLWNPLYKIMQKEVKKKLIVISQTVAYELEIDTQIHREKNDHYSFDNLTTISRRKLLRTPVTQFQGQQTTTSFGELLGIDDFDNLAADELEHLSEIIDPQTLVQLINSFDGMKIGADLEGLGKIKNYFIHRTVRRKVVIKEDILRDMKRTDLLAVSGIDLEYSGKAMRMGKSFTMYRNLMTHVYPADDIDRNHHSEIVHAGSSSTMEEYPKNLTILGGAREEEQFRALCAKNVTSNVHWLVKKSGKYIWMKSQGDIAYLLQYRELRENGNNDEMAIMNHLSTDQLAAHGERVIISDKAGMGKSVLLTYLAGKIKEAEPDMLVLKIDLNHNATALAEVKRKSSYDLADFNGAVQFLVNDLLGHETNLTRKVFKAIIKKQRRVALIFDGFDEISPTYEDTVIQLLGTLADHGIKKMFCGTRPHTREELEKKLESFSYELQPLSADDQEDFLVRFWKNKFFSHSDCEDRTNGRIRKYAKAIMEKLANSINDQKKEFTGIPLQAKLVAKIFGNHGGGRREDFDYCKEFIDSGADQPNFPRRINLIYLYELFVEQKFEIFFKKTGGDLENEAGKEIRRLSHEKFMDTHKRLALRVLFEEDEVKELLQCEEDTPDITNERTGIITQFIDGRPLFGHRSYAEYFAAKFILNMLQKGVQNQSSRRILVKNVLLSGNYGNVRAFLNWLLSNEHIITLEIKSWEYHLKKDRSELNETIFHIAAKEGNDQIIRLFMDCMVTNPKDMEVLINMKDSDGRTAVHQAAQRGRIDEMKLLMEDTNFEINSEDMQGSTPLYIAAQEGKLDIVKYLLDKGANINSRDKGGWLPLHVAAREGQLDVVKYLLDNGADVSSQDNRGWMALHIAAARNQLDVVKYLIENGASVNWQVVGGLTPLHTAVGSGGSDVVMYLLDVGAIVDPRQEQGWTPLHYAANDAKLEVVEYLLIKGADVNCLNNHGWTPLHIAALAHQLDIVRYLLDNGANINSKSNSGSTPLHTAATCDEFDTIEYLLSKGADVHSLDENGRTPLHVAAEEGKLGVVKYLLVRGADINHQDESGQTPLHIAALEGKLEVVKYFVDKGVNVDFQDANGRSPLFIAALEGQSDVVKYLLDIGADVNSRSHGGYTPLHAAANNNDLNIIEYMLVKGADVNYLSYFSQTPLHVAAMNGQLDVVKYLLEKGADIYSKDLYGATPLKAAILAGESKVVKYLRGRMIRGIFQWFWDLFLCRMYQGL